jgi:hypothetical protein
MQVGPFLAALALGFTHFLAACIGWRFRERIKTLEPVTVAVPLRSYGRADLDEVAESGLIPEDDRE